MGQHFVTMPHIGPDTQRRAEMIKHDDGAGCAPRQLNHFGQLVVKGPHVETQSSLAEGAYAVDKLRTKPQARRRLEMVIEYFRMWVPRD